MQYAFLRSPKTALQLWRKTAVHFARNCFETTKLKKWLKLMASKKKISKHWEKKSGKENLTIELEKRKNWQNWKFYRGADIVYCIYWPSLTFIFLPRVDLLNYFDCFQRSYVRALAQRDNYFKRKNCFDRSGKLLFLGYLQVYVSSSKLTSHSNKMDHHGIDWKVLKMIEDLIFWNNI